MGDTFTERHFFPLFCDRNGQIFKNKTHVVIKQIYPSVAVRVLGSNSTLCWRKCSVKLYVCVPEGDAVFVVKLQDFTATEKDEVSLDCELSKDVPVVWYHSEKEITASKMVVLKSEGTRRSLVLKKVEQSDKGKYVCDCGTDKTSAYINIEGKGDETIS